MLSNKSLELRNKYLEEVSHLLPKVLKNLQRIHRLAMKNKHFLKKEVE